MRIAIVLLLAGPARAPVIKIVSSLPRTGSAKAQTDFIVNGIRMAIDEAGGKAGGFRIETEDWDSATAAEGKWMAVLEAENAAKAVRDEDVMVYLGTYNSGAAKLSMPILNNAGLLMISPASTWPGLTKAGDPGEPGRYRPTGKLNFCRVVPTDDIQGQAGADWAASTGVRAVYVLDDGEVYGRGVADSFQARARELNLEVLGRESIAADAQTYIALLEKVRAAMPELVYFGGTTQTKAGTIAREMKAVAMHCPFLVPDGCFEDAFIESAGAESLNNRTYVTWGSAASERFPDFTRRYRAKYGMAPGGYAIYGYEAARVALKAIEKAGRKDRAAICESGLGIRNFRGALGPWSFDSNGDTTLRTTSIYRVEDGKFKFEKRIDPRPVGRLYK